MSTHAELGAKTLMEIYEGVERNEFINMAIDIETKAEKYYEIIPDQCKDSYYQLVYYPAAATGANLYFVDKM